MSRFAGRGGGWLLGQLPLMLGTIAVAPWLGALATGPTRMIAGALLAAGIALVLWSRATLGLLTLAGWALLWQSMPAAVLVAVLAVLLDFKARREEAWLAESYPSYGDYKRRTRKLIPFVY